MLFILSLKLAKIRGDINKNIYDDNIKNLIKIPEAIEESLKSENNIQLVAKEFLNAKGSMFLGRGSSFPIALEGALKIKRIILLACRRIPCWRNETWPTSFD